MKKTLYFVGLFIVGFFAGRGIILSVVNVSSTSVEKELISKQATIDSLHDENFNLSTEIGRYELTFDYLKEIDSVSWKKADYFLSHETE